MRVYSDLKIFNPALVYSFEPESSPKALLYDEDLNESIFKISQHNDMLEAYYYAEQKILPWITENGLSALKPEIFEEWILELHKRMGRSLLSLSDEMNSGEYSKTQVIRWHYGTHMMQLLGMHFGKLFPKDMSDEEFLNCLTKVCSGLSIEDAREFLHILQRLEKDDKAPIHSTLEKTMKLYGPLVGFTLALNRLTTAWHDDLLTDHEREVVGKVALFVDYPEKLPDRMKDFSSKMVQELQKLSKDDLKAVSAFCAELFFQFTNIHPFPNGNGRTATALMNIILQSIGLPDIIMRKPGERNATEGSYAKAIACIERDRVPLANHIHERILEAQKKPFQDSVLEKLIQLRMEMNDFSKKIKSIEPEFDLSTITQVVVKQYPMLQKMDCNDPKNSIIACQLLIPKLEQQYLSMLKQPELPFRASNVSMMKPVYNRKALNDKIEDVSCVTHWKISMKDSLSIWRYCDSEQEAKEIVERVSNYEFCHAAVRKTMGKGKVIVLCNDVDVSKMLSVEKATEHSFQ